MSPALVDFLRICIVALAVNSSILLCALLWPVRLKISHGLRLISQGAVLVLVAIGYATLESALRHVPGAPRLWWLAVGLLWLWVGLVVTLIERRTR